MKMHFTPDIQRALGDAVLVPDGDIVYILGESWILVLARPEDSIDPGILNWLRSSECTRSRYRVDWRVLTASEIDFAQGKFLPHRSRKFESLHVGSLLKTYSSSPDGLREVFESRYTASIFGDTVNLSELWQSGKVRAVYPPKSESGEFAKVDSAEHYVFRFNDKVLYLEGGPWRALAELGFVATAPLQNYTNLAIPPVGLRLGEDLDAVGIIHPSDDAPLKTDKQGRTLPMSALYSCWIEEGDALALLVHPDSYQVGGDTLGDDLSAPFAGSTLLRAISSLAWRGWSAEDIRATYEDGRVAAYKAKLNNLDGLVAEVIQRLEAGDVSTWQLRSLEKNLEFYLNVYQAINEELGTPDLGSFPEAISLLQDVTEAQPTRQWRAP